ncbi:hypothetical protein SAMN04488082_1401, partial [Desulfomicrobium apsheronum]
IEDKKGQEEIYVHAEKDVNVYVKNDWKEHILHDQHRTVDNFSYSLVKGEDQQTVELNRKIELLSDDHLTVRGSSHRRFGDKWLLDAGNEIHAQAGRKTVIEADAELTIKAGGGFIRIDPSGVYVGGTKVKINSGGSPGLGTGARPLPPADSKMVENGTVPKNQTETLRKAGDNAFCQICEVNKHSVKHCLYNNENFHDENELTRQEYYYEINEEYKISKLANIMTEGSGLLHPGGSFSLSGIIRIESKYPARLFISSEGYTAIENIADSVNFWAKARIEKNGVIIEEKSLKLNADGYIRSLPHRSHIIGEAIFILPKPKDGIALNLILTGSYFAKIGESTSVPSMFVSGIQHVKAEKSFEIKLMR